MADVAVIILTKNEEIHIARCIDAIKSFAHSIHVIDAGSTDRTREIAAENGAEILQHPWLNYSDQFQWACDNITTTARWIMRLDADEIVEPDLSTTIERNLPALPPTVVGVTMDRKHIFMGRWVKHGGRYPLRLLRIFRRGKGRIEQRWMDEHIFVWGGETTHFEGGLADHNLNDLDFFIAKHVKYAKREAIDVLNQKLGLFEADISLPADGSRQAAIKRWAKEKIYNSVPFPIAALSYFLFRYTIQLGFLDGREGTIYHFLQGYWYRFQVGAQLAEFQRAIEQSHEPPLVTLERITGFRLSTALPRE